MKPSEEIRAAVTVVHQQLLVSKKAMYLTTIREVPVAPIAAWLSEAADLYALYDDRGWSETVVDARVSSSVRAALEFARSINPSVGAR